MPKKTKYGNILQFAKEDTQVATFKGSTYRKQIVKFGEWVNPDFPWFSDDPTMTLDEAWAETIIKNFNEDSLGSPVTVPLNHTDDVKVNTGLVKSLESVAGDGLYAEMEILDEDTIAKLDKGLIFDVSISFVWDFIRQDNGKHYGATLLHVALVNTPYLIGMNAFEKVGQALSKLNNSFKPVGLSHLADGAIMLSRTKVKELSKMDLSTIKNDKEFDVTVTFKDGDEDKEVVVKAGEEVEVPTEVAGDVTTQIADAEAPEADPEADPIADPEEDPEADPEKDDEEEDEEDEAKKSKKDELSSVRLENAELKLNKAYEDLLALGKVVPAQKEKILGLAKLSNGVQLSTASGAKIDLSTVVLEILQAGTKQFSTDESGSDKEDPNPPAPDADEDDNADKKPSETLSEAELAGFKAVGADVAKMDEMAEKDPVFAQALANLSKQYNSKKESK